MCFNVETYNYRGILKIMPVLLKCKFQVNTRILAAPTPEKVLEALTTVRTTCTFTSVHKIVKQVCLNNGVDYTTTGNKAVDAIRILYGTSLR